MLLFYVLVPAPLIAIYGRQLCMITALQQHCIVARARGTCTQPSATVRNAAGNQACIVYFHSVSRNLGNGPYQNVELR